MEKKTKELVFSFVLAILGIYVFVEGLLIYKRAASAPYFITEFSISPGFLPVILGAFLFIFSIIFAFGLLKGSDDIKGDLSKHVNKACKGIKEYITSQETLFTAGGVVIMAIYSFILMEILPFWIASIIFLLALFFYLRAAKWWMNIIVAMGAIALVVIVFQYCFNAALP